MKLTAGDWVLFEFELNQVAKAEPRFELTDGLARISGNHLDERCRPLTLENKRISDYYDWNSTRLHSEGVSGLNYPDIHRWLVQHWLVTCDAAESDRSQRIEELNKFVESILTKSDIDSGYGFPLLRPKR